MAKKSAKKDTAMTVGQLIDALTKLRRDKRVVFVDFEGEGPALSVEHVSTSEDYAASIVDGQLEGADDEVQTFIVGDLGLHLDDTEVVIGGVCRDWQP